MSQIKNIHVFLLVVLSWLFAISCQHNSLDSKTEKQNAAATILTKDSVMQSIDDTILIERLLLGERRAEMFSFSAPYPIPNKAKINELSYLKQLCVNYFLGTSYSLSNVKRLNEIWEGRLYRIGFCKVYDLELKGVPNSAAPRTILIVNLDKGLMYRLNLQKLELIKIHDSLPPVFSGRYFFRGAGSFYSYYVINDTLYNFFESELVTRICRDGFCVCYEDNFLKLDNSDIDGDGFRDLQFSGQKIIRCFDDDTARDESPGDSILKKRTYFLRKKKEHFYYLRIDSLSVPVITAGTNLAK